MIEVAAVVVAFVAGFLFCAISVGCLLEAWYRRSKGMYPFSSGDD